MRKLILTARVSVLLIFVLLLFSGCGSYKRLTEETIFQENINAFFSALDNEDSTAIKSLFSQTVNDTDADLNVQIEKLISIYPKASTEIKFNGLVGSSYDSEYGQFKSVVFTTFPVVCDNEYFWVYFELIYEDDFSEKNIGLNKVFFYTADEYCAFWHDENSQYPEDIGLLVFSDLNFEKEIRPIESFPYEYTSIEREISVSDVEDFLETSKSFTEFNEVFGSPNAKGKVKRWTILSPSTYFSQL